MPLGAPAVKELVEMLARKMVNNPDAVEVREVHGDAALVP